MVRALRGSRRRAPPEAGRLPVGSRCPPDAPARGTLQAGDRRRRGPQLKDEPLLAGGFGFIEVRYRQQISLKEVARAVGLSPAHLTTDVRRKTGRTVLGWISERRMTEAWRLLVETDLPPEEIGRGQGAPARTTS